MTTREQVRALAIYVIDHSGRFPRPYGSEEAHDDHDSHDDAHMHPSCVHCALYLLHRPDVTVDGDRAVGALVQLAAGLLAEHGHDRLAEWLAAGWPADAAAAAIEAGLPGWEPEQVSERLAEEAGA